MNLARQRSPSGNRYSDRLCSQIARIMHDYAGPMTNRMIYERHCGLWKNNPTRNELANYLGKSGYFIKQAERVAERHVAQTSMGQLWTLDFEKCRSRGWFELPMQNRHLDDPLPLRE